MPVNLIKKLTSKLRGNPDSGSSKPAQGKAAGSRSAKKGAHGGGKTQESPADKLVAGGAGEVWRPGDGPGKPVRESRRSEGDDRSRRRRPSREQPAGSRPDRRSGRRAPAAAPAASTAPAPSAAPAAATDTPPADDASRQENAPRRRRPRRRSRKPAAEGAQPSEQQAAVDAPPPSRPKPTSAEAVDAELVARHAAWSLDDFPVEPVAGRTRFHDLDLPSEIMHAVDDLGFKYCTPIQAGVLIPARQGRNVTGQAQTGTGKTAAFLIATFSRFHDNPKRCKIGQPRALVIAPTRELVVQIADDAEGLSKYSGFKCQAIYGGMDMEKQRRRLEGGPIELIAATPGRLLDFVNRGVLDLSRIEVLVIDEADRMLDMGFIPDVRRIVRATPPREKRQTLFFSATMNSDVEGLLSQWMPDPVKVEIEPEQVAVDTVRQLVYIVTASEKFKVLFNILKLDHVGRVLIFANRRLSTERLARELQSRGIDCELLSGAVNQNKRMRVLEDFKSGKVSVVVATDVAGRGLHVDSIDHVINFDFPYEPDDYVHRIGRTGRAGASGTAISFACEDESFIIPEIEAYIGEELVCKMPEEILLKEPPRPFRKSTVTTDSTPVARGGGGGGRRSGPGGGSRSSGGGGRRPAGGGSGTHRSGTRHH